jgi:hypothetical protein
VISGRLSLNQAELARDLLQGSHQRAGRKLAPGVCDGDPLLLGLWLIIERACASIHASAITEGLRERPPRTAAPRGRRRVMQPP